MSEQVAKLELVNLRLRYPVSEKDHPDKSSDPGLAVDLKGSGNLTPIRIPAGEFTVLLGPSGCGKSSLLRMIAGLVKPTDGTVLKDGRPITGPGRDRGLVFQSYTSFPWLTVERNVLFGLELQRSENHGSKKAIEGERIQKAREVIELVKLSDAIHKYPRELSGGMKQRVAIARALANDPDVLLMDEPFGALDPHIRLRMQELMLEVERELKTTIVFVTHDAREAVFLGDTIYIATLRPCFLRFRINHPFNKEIISREKARERHENDFLRFQMQVEGLMQSLINHPETPRDNQELINFERSTLGVLEDLSN